MWTRISKCHGEGGGVGGGGVGVWGGGSQAIDGLSRICSLIAGGEVSVTKEGET